MKRRHLLHIGHVEGLDLCPRCRALVYAGDLHDHLRWHDQHLRMVDDLRARLSTARVRSLLWRLIVR